MKNREILKTEIVNYNFSVKLRATQTSRGVLRIFRTQ